MTRKLQSWWPLGLMVGGILLALTCEAIGLRVNLTASLPRGVYRQLDRPVQVGDLVAGCLPAEVSRFGRERGYLPAGSCTTGDAPILKRVAAEPGDEVGITAEGVFARGRFIQPPAPDRDHSGDLLDVVPPGTVRVAPGQLWLFTPAAHSWDSRFFGPVALEAPRVLLPVWTFGGR